VAEKKFLDLLDRFDGGGMGKSGGKFEGGGLLSMLGNLLADPYGSYDEDRMESRNQFYNAQGDAVAPPSLLAPKSGNRAAPTATSNNQTVSARPAPPTDAQRFGLNPPADYSSTPVNVGAPPSYTQPSSMQTPVNYDDGSGMTPVNNYVDPFAGDSFSYNGNREAGMKGPNLQGSGITPNNNYPDPRQRFASQLVEMIGPDAAESMMNSGMGEQAYQAFVANNYNMPNYLG